MGYLDNTSITVDAILTKRGRELLSRNDGSFRITQFALGDDEIDYTLFNENHPNGTQFAAEAIENMPLIEAIPDGTNMMKSQLITLKRGRSLLPFITVQGFATDSSTIELIKGQGPISIDPRTSNFTEDSTSATNETRGYKFTIINFNYLDSFVASGGTNVMQTGTELDVYGDSNVAEVVMGNSLTLSPTNDNALFPLNTTVLTTTLIIEGLDTGAKKSIQVTVSKNTEAQENRN